ncbi:hypothetical protein McanMca71_000694 [Microsporum canis]|uniref:DNA mismatch repair protein msh-2 n=1 Tax=Arthroderma otae (strain ATCC MYA-4605 / CBS 113480) TaxID=554155 RepID=C5FLN5_ARTOC|nr:DNA mismatch repair protein msh-2 [Microsporum canis CBS 113480]EEQ30607.1 DNA mismatch repair protein msh-2 [Microsporum canis CBS 113480]
MAIKTRTATATRSTTARLPTKQPGITAFTRVGKAGAQVASTKDTIFRKRKLEESTQGDSEPVLQICPFDETPTKRSKTEKQTRKHENPAIFLAEDTSEPSVGTPSTPPNHGEPSSKQPIEFLDLVDLNSAFLSALSLHFAHNGPTAPANLREILSSTERIWNKRKVAVQDIQRVLYIQGLCPSSVSSNPGLTSQNEFKLTSYGTNTFLERSERPASSKSSNTLPLNDLALKAEFLANLEYYWEENIKEDNNRASSQDILRNIPLATIYPSKGPVKPLDKGGQRTIDQLFGALKSKPMLTREPYTKKPGPMKDSVTTSNRRNGLLERMKMKALHQSKLSPPPSKEIVLKQTAVGRISEVINVLLLLSPLGSKIDDTMGTSPSRKSYTMDLIIQRIEDSMRTPASKQEIEACIDILSQSTVAKDWVTIVKTNQVKSVVLRSDRRPSPAKIIHESMNLKF